jgi:hypothetical protein
MPAVFKSLAFLLGAGTIAAIAASSDDGLAHREVAGNRFEVPVDHLFDATISWLPAPEEDSFVFLFQPNPTPDQIPKHRVLVQRLSRFCPGDASQMLRVACGQEQTSVSDGPPYEKVQNELGSWSSDIYSVDARPGENGVKDKRQIAYCQLFEPNPVKPEPSNLCTTFWAYDGMMLQFSFDETELPKMRTMKAEAMALLDSWRVR